MSRQGFRRDYVLAAGGQLAQALAGFVGVALLARILGPADFGLFVLLSTVVIIANVALISGLQAGSLAVGARDRQAYRHMHGLVSSIGIAVMIGAIAATLLADLVQVELFPELTPTEVAATAYRIAATAYAGLVGTMLAAVGRIGLMAFLTVTTAITSLIAVASAGIAPDPLAGAVVGAMVGSLVTAAVAFLLAIMVLGIPRLPTRALTTSVVRVAIPMQLGVIGYWVLLRGDAFVVNAVIGGASVGIYALALTISEKIGMATAPLYNATAWRVVGSDKQLAMTTTLRLARIEIGVGICAVVATWFLGPVVIRVLGGASYEDAFIPLVILAFGAAVLPLWSTIGLYLISHLHMAWRTAAIQIVVALAALVGYAVAVPRFGMTGAAAISTLGYVALVAAGLSLMRRDSSSALVPVGGDGAVGQRFGSDPSLGSHPSDPR